MAPVWGHIYLPPLAASARAHARMPMAAPFTSRALRPSCAFATQSNYRVPHLMAPLPATQNYAAIIPKASPNKPPPPAAPPKNSSRLLPPGAKCGARREILRGLIAAGAGFLLAPDIASAASKRRPPPPATEKKDPNVTGVQAKVLASKKRKEAMKEFVAKMREKGKPVNN